MTRESRIGLLVGMVFIFAFGLMLSELTGNETEPVTASVTYDGSEVRPSPLREPMPEQLRGNPRQTPAQQVRRRHEQRPAQPATDAGTRDRQPRALRHTVQRGETLIGLARRYYGPEEGDMYTRIHEANRDVIPDPSNLPVGREIVIPGPADGRPESTGRQEQEPAGEPAYVTYTVVEGDSLTKIAGKVLGDDSHRAVRKIYEANTDVLASPDRLIVGTEIRIPR